MNWLRRLFWRDRERVELDQRLDRLEMRSRDVDRRTLRVRAEQDQLVKTLRGTVHALRADRR